MQITARSSPLELLTLQLIDVVSPHFAITAPASVNANRIQILRVASENPLVNIAWRYLRPPVMLSSSLVLCAPKILSISCRNFNPRTMQT